jgi:hypothetical protein
VWFAEIVSSLIYGFGELMTNSKWGRRIVVALMVALGVTVAVVLS